MLDLIRDGRTDLVFDHIAQGHRVDGSLLRWCAYYGDVSALRFALAHGSDLADLGDNLDLNGAAFHGHWQLCQFLIERGADVNHPLPDTGETPLHAALSKPDRHHVVEVLLAGGADPTRATKPGVETGSFMRDCRTRGETPLHRAAAFCDAETIRLLLDAGAALDARDCNGDTPLTWASWYLRPGPILRLLCHGPHSISPAWVGLTTSLRGKPHV